MTVSFDVQEYFSHITGLREIIMGDKVDQLINQATTAQKQVTIKNPRLDGVLRPFTCKAESDVEVKAKAARMFAGAVSYQIKVSTWRDAQGHLWKPNTLLSLVVSLAMIYIPYTFLVRSVQFADDRSATLELIIPEAYTDGLPERLPWDE